MDRPSAVEIPSDEDDASLPSSKTKKRRKEQSEPPILVLIDDITPQKPPLTATPSFVPETPMSDHLLESDSSIVKCTFVRSNPGTRPQRGNLSGITSLICLESDNESEDSHQSEMPKENETTAISFGLAEYSETSHRFTDVASPHRTDNIIQILGDSPMHGDRSEDAAQIFHVHDQENAMLEQVVDIMKRKDTSVAVNLERNNKTENVTRRKQLKDEKNRLNEEKKLKRMQEKLQKAALKAEAAEMKKLQKEKQKWEKGKLAIKSIVAEIDTKVVEVGSIGGHLLTRFAEKGLTFRVTSNPIERSILWKMSVPEQISELSSKGSDVPYVVIVYEADEFCDLVISESLMDHVYRVQSHYPSYTICYSTNKLMAYINKREKEQYKNPSNLNSWRRPPVEEMLAKLATHFVRVHSRQCMDEAELAEHIVGLTCSLANCQFRKKLTRLSVNANGSHIPKDFIDKNLIKKSMWLKALVAIPKVQPRFAMAIGKKYPTMRSLLNVYMDPTKSVHEKEFLLKDLTIEGMLGNEDRRLGEVCSKRVYRILMAQSGGIKTDDVEDGADFFGF